MSGIKDRSYACKCPSASPSRTSYFLWRATGLGIASELLLTGRQLGAERAHQVGARSAV